MSFTHMDCPETDTGIEGSLRATEEGQAAGQSVSTTIMG